MAISFDVAPADRAEVQADLTDRYERKLSELGINFEKERLNEIVGIFYPAYDESRTTSSLSSHNKPMPYGTVNAPALTAFCSKWNRAVLSRK